jgi:hypothetical protein
MQRRVAFLIAFVGLAGCSLREPFMRPESAKVVAMLGASSGFQGGAPCASPMEMANAYLEEIGHDSSKPLVETVPRFARRAAKLCPGSRPVINTANDVEFAKVASLLGGSAFSGDGRMQMEPWLWLRVSSGKVIGLELQLDQI